MEDKFKPTVTLGDGSTYLLPTRGQVVGQTVSIHGNIFVWTGESWIHWNDKFKRFQQTTIDSIDAMLHDEDFLGELEKL